MKIPFSAKFQKVIVHNINLIRSTCIIPVVTSYPTGSWFEQTHVDLTLGSILRYKIKHLKYHILFFALHGDQFFFLCLFCAWMALIFILGDINSKIQDLPSHFVISCKLKWPRSGPVDHYTCMNMAKLAYQFDNLLFCGLDCEISDHDCCSTLTQRLPVWISSNIYQVIR